MKLVLAYIALTVVLAVFSFNAGHWVEPGTRSWVIAGLGIFFLGLVIGRLSVKRGAFVIATMLVCTTVIVFAGFTSGLVVNPILGLVMTAVYLFGFIAGVSLSFLTFHSSSRTVRSS